MASEDQEMMKKISQLAGQINRHKNQKEQTHPANAYGGPSSSSAWLPNRGGYQGRGVRGRGYPRGRGTQAYRNKTLVLNSGSSTPADENSTNTSEDSHTPMSWVTKNDRHLQLINPAIFEKQSQDRAKAIEETRMRRLKQRDEREKLKLSRHLQRAGPTASNGMAQVRSSTTPLHEIVVAGIRFRVVKGGSKLMKIPGDENNISTPKTATVGGVRFFRSKNGNMYRSGVVKAQRRTGIVKKVDEPCKVFTTTGSCLKGPRCRYIHDPSKVAACREFLQKGLCSAGDNCDLSHDLTAQRSPTCLHFARGNCSNASCRYSHVRVSPAALVCRNFGIYGYCDKGAECTERHVSECPDFSNTGTCGTKGCKLIHRDKASNIRKKAAAGEHLQDGGNSDLSSDEELDEMDSDDVDSDDLEFLGDDDGVADQDVPMQHDYVKF